MGTDYNIGGIKGIGSKTALKLVKMHGNDFDALFTKVKWDDYFDFEWTELFYLIKKMPVTDEYKIEWTPVDHDKVKELLCEQHDFDAEHVENMLQKLIKSNNSRPRSQKGLSDWLK